MKSAPVTIVFACLLLALPLLASEASAPDATETQPAVAAAAAAMPPTAPAEAVAPRTLLCAAATAGLFDPAVEPLANKGGRDDDSLPNPEEFCLTGWCSNDAQCEEWFEPGCICRKQPGATCGQCLCA